MIIRCNTVNLYFIRRKLIIQPWRNTNQRWIIKFPYDLDKGEKHRMDILYYANIVVGQDANNDNIIERKAIKRSVEVCICQHARLEEIFWTYNKFIRACCISNMAWVATSLNFTNCLGQIPWLKLEQGIPKYWEEQGHNYTNDENGFNLIIKHYVSEMYKDQHARGTLKHSVFNGHYQKPEDV